MPVIPDFKQKPQETLALQESLKKLIKLWRTLVFVWLVGWFEKFLQDSSVILRAVTS